LRTFRSTIPARPGRAAAGASGLRRSYYEATGTAASHVAVKIALDHLEARAQSDGPERSVHLHVAEHAGCIYLDLADDQWRAVEIAPNGWRVIDTPPVRFRRLPGLPMPERGGSLDALRSWLNLPARPLRAGGGRAPGSIAGGRPLPAPRRLPINSA